MLDPRLGVFIDCHAKTPEAPVARQPLPHPAAQETSAVGVSLEPVSSRMSHPGIRVVLSSMALCHPIRLPVTRPASLCTSAIRAGIRGNIMGILDLSRLSLAAGRNTRFAVAVLRFLGGGSRQIAISRTPLLCLPWMRLVQGTKRRCFCALPPRLR